MRKVNKSKKAPVAATPPLRWVGGKRGVMDKILPHVRKDMTRIVIPFFGGGGDSAVFAAAFPEVEIFASDALKPIVGLFKQMDDQDFLGHIRLFDDRYRTMNKAQRKAWFYENRAAWDDLDDGPFKWASLFFHMRVCYSGLYRPLASGRLGGTAGYMVTKSIGRLDACEPWAKFCRKVHLETIDFRDAVYSRVKPGALLYLDPPYKGTYDGYCGNDKFPQHELAPIAKVAKELGAGQILMSQNAGHDEYWLDQFSAAGLEIVIHRGISRKETVRATKGESFKDAKEVLIEVVS